MSRAPAAPGPPRSSWAVFAVCAGAAYVTTLDLSIVNVAFPEILREFEGTSRADLSWIVTVYNICYGALLVAGGKTADQLGRKRVFLGGVLVFALGSVLCTVAPGLGVLVAGRAVQGVGGAFMAPASLGLLLSAFPTERRTQIVAMWGGVGALGVASGPSLGALLITGTDWRAAFWINIPVCLALALVGRAVLRATPRVASTERPDFGGAVMVTLALAAVALGLSQSEVWSWLDARTLGSLVVGGSLIAVFVARQRRHADPLLDLSLFESRAFTVANAAGLVFFAGFAALGLNNVLFLRQVWGYSVLHAGLLSALAPATVAMLAPLAGKLAARHGFKPFVIAGPVLLAMAVVLNRVLLSTDRAPLTFVLTSEVAAMGIACFIPVNAGAAVADLPAGRLSIGGAINNTGRQVGAVLGVALLVAVIGSGDAAGALLAGHRRGWILIAVCALVATLISLAQPGVRRAVPVSRPAPRLDPVLVPDTASGI
jgi:EmrB/QacA subfamily drug resistance transporter